MPTELTKKESARLARLETEIEKGFDSFLAVGCYLQEIRESRLYRATDSTFESYCRRRWKFSRSKAYRLISFAEVVENLSPIGDKLKESQARQLAFLPAEVQREIMDRASSQPTAGELRQLVVEHVRQEENDCLQELARPRQPGKDLVRRINELLDRLEKLLIRLDTAERPDDARQIGARLRELADLA